MTQQDSYQHGINNGQALVDPGLTKREWEVLTMIFQGHTNNEIADRLGIRTQTVKNHTSNLLRKMQAKNRTHAAMIAISRGWGEKILDAIAMI